MNELIVVNMLYFKIHSQKKRDYSQKASKNNITSSTTIIKKQQQQNFDEIFK